MTSLLGRVAIAALRTMRGKRDLRDKASLDAAIARRRPIDRHAPTRKYRTTYRVRVDDYRGHPIYRLSTRGAPPVLRVLYIHGGCYTYEISGYHWEFLGRLATELEKAGMPAEITIPIYPLAPEHDHRDAFAMIEPLVDELAAETPSRCVLVGDSAGGAIALAIAQQRLLANKPQPRAIVLLSPWLDIALTNPAIDNALERADPMLGRGGLVAAGTYWRGALPVTSHLVSPLHGPVDGLAKVILLGAGKEIFLPDIRALRSRIPSAAYREEPGMFHVWPLVTLLPEARRAIDWIVRELRVA